VNIEEKLKIVNEKLSAGERNLEKLADFLLQGEKLVEDDVEYDIYTDRKLFEKALKDNNNPNVLVFFKECRNYKKEKKQEIFMDDLVNEPALLDYQMLIDEFRKLKKGHICGRLKTDQIIAKDKLKGTIYFKSLMNDSTKPEYEFFNFTDIEQVICLMKFSKRKLKDSEVVNVSELIYDLEILLDKCVLTDNEKRVLHLWREDDATQESIGDVVGISQQAVSETLYSIASKVAKQYHGVYEDWLYLNYIKGNYKTCSKCGETKLVSKFDTDNREKDRLYRLCKRCR